MAVKIHTRISFSSEGVGFLWKSILSRDNIMLHSTLVQETRGINICLANQLISLGEQPVKSLSKHFRKKGSGTVMTRLYSRALQIFNLYGFSRINTDILIT